ncbi:MAG TPA: TerB family tellurite resistance protein [Vicinamibacterales bacterium]|nr:TerB family tellurite resistance protein [Vicinamibacterales bacterium]
MGIFLDVFGREPADVDDCRDAIHRIANELDRLDPDYARYLASFACILSRVASADRVVSGDEVAAMERCVIDKGRVSVEQAAMVVEMARTHQKLFGATDDFLVTREVARTASYDQKLALIDCLYSVASADKRILSSEGDEIGRIGRELKVDQADLSKLRSHYRDFLEARKGLPSSG